jgi:hypothetical protein
MIAMRRGKTLAAFDVIGPVRELLDEIRTELSRLKAQIAAVYMVLAEVAQW